MADAAKKFEGEHDFRNFCKVFVAMNFMLTSLTGSVCHEHCIQMDIAGGVTNFRRRIFSVDINPVDTR